MAGQTASLIGLVSSEYHRFVAQRRADASPGDGVEAVLRALHSVVVLRFCEARGHEPAGTVRALALAAKNADAARQAMARTRQRYGPVFDDAVAPALVADHEALLCFVSALYTDEASRLFAAAPVEALGQAYEQCLALGERGRARKAAGIYYTPGAIARAVVEQTVGALCADMPAHEDARARGPVRIRVLDPACGAGIFLLRAYERLWHAHLDYWMQTPEEAAQRGHLVRVAGTWRLTRAESHRILLHSIFGVDRDGHALALARLGLLLQLHELCGQPIEHMAQTDERAAGREHPWHDNLRQGDALFMSGSGAGHPAGEFDVVVGNPPWGQKALSAAAPVRAALQRAYPSSRGIFDWFRPFVELGVRLTRAGGYVGMVLPDIVLLKNYELTRRFLLDHLAMERIEWLGKAFAGATIDAVTVAGRRAPAAPGHAVEVIVNEPGERLHHWLRQDDFRENPRTTFNLHMTESKRRLINQLGENPRLGEYFEVHEGVHSGNMRAELFVAERVDDSCEELFFGRDELRPYVLKWAGYYVRLSVAPARRTRERYANLGRQHWHRSAKVLVRRTGDRVTAAVDEARRYASNNFFLLVPTRAHPLDLDGLAALLNSELMTWYFRTIEPRKGRAFAEIKIKHLVDFPVPGVARVDECRYLNELGAAQRRCETGGEPGEAGAERRREIERRVRSLLGI